MLRMWKPSTNVECVAGNARLLRGCRRADACREGSPRCEARYKPVGLAGLVAEFLRHASPRRHDPAPVAERKDRIAGMERADLTTNCDPPGRWYIDDAVVRLRLWATEY